MTPFPGFRTAHFVGIGGAGMCGLAEVMAAGGFSVSGSDLKESPATRYLGEKGIPVVIGHESTPAAGWDVAVYSSAVPWDNPELKSARDAGIPVIKRAVLLGEMMKKKWAAGVSGTHGKTTTTLMLGAIWDHAQYDPTVIAGGTSRGDRSGVLLGKGPYLIAEADEYDKSFLSMYPTVLLITNIDDDHLECYGSREQLQDAFLEAANRLPFCGFCVVNRDDPGTGAIIPKMQCRAITYGFSETSDYRGVLIGDGSSACVMDVYKANSCLARVRLQVYGRHNASNALGAFALSHAMGISPDRITAGLFSFQGAGRRMEKTGETGGILFLDDYAHHPAEVRATLAALREFHTGRIVAVFQPHLYTRTQRFYREFAEAFMVSDVLFVTRVFPSRESALPGVEGDLIVTQAVENGHPLAVYLKDPEEAAGTIGRALKPGDAVITVGAGDIRDLGQHVFKLVEGKC